MLFHIDPLRLWVHKVLPVVYDDSLSYYEVLAKVTKKLNEVIDLTEEQNQYIEEFSTNLTNAINHWEDGMEQEWSSYKSGLNNEWGAFQRNTEQYIENWKNMAESDIEDAIAAGINQFVSYFSDLTQTAVDAAEEAMRAAENAAEEAVEAVMPTLESEFDERYAWKTAVGSPLVATTAAGMTDTTKVYVYAGSESGYVNGDWYYYDGTAWQDGGVYNSAAVVTDPTLSESGVPADAKAAGDEIADLKSAINFGKTATPGYILTATNNGTGQTWSPVGTPTDAQTEAAISDWLNDHPEATTTVQDHSLTWEKLVNGTLGFVTPEMFGAIGNGTTDDATAVNSCLTYAATNRLLVVFDKIYGVANAITLPNNTQIKGTNYNYSGLKLIAEKNNVLVAGGFADIENITIDGNNFATDSLLIANAYCNVRRCLIKGGNNSEIKLKNTYCNEIHNNRIYGGDYGIICSFDTLQNSASQNATTVTDNIILFCEKYALVIGGGDSWRIERNTIEHAKLGAGVFTGFRNLTFNNNYIEQSGKYSNQFTLTNSTFYLRTILQFNYSENFNTFTAGSGGYSAVVENNFVNICGEANDNTIPSEYEDLTTFILANAVNDLIINNNTCVDSGNMSIFAIVRRSANSNFNNCKLSNNYNFKPAIAIGGNYQSLTVCPNVYNEQLPQYNYFGSKDFNNFAGLTFTENANEYWLGHKVYECSTNDTFGNFTTSKDALSGLSGKTIIIGFYANVPTGVGIEFYANQGIVFSERCRIRNITFGEWTFVGMALPVPSILDQDFRFYVWFTGITDTPLKVSKLVLTEIGVPPQNALEKI